MRAHRLATCLVLALRTTAAAGPAPDDVPTDDRVAPRPGDEIGRTDTVDPPDSLTRRLARGALFVPKLALEAVLAPPRAAIWANDRYQLEDRFYRTFFNADRTIGLYPTASYTSGTGAMLGVHFEDVDTFGAKERLVAHAATGAAFGERDRDLVRGSLRSGPRWRRLELGFDASFARRPDDRFYGIGNADPAMRPATAIDPIVDETAVSTRYRWQEARVAASATATLVGALKLQATGAVTDITLGRSTTGVPIDEAYARTGLVGFADGIAQGYGELELRYDTRRAGDGWDPPDVHAAGTLASISLGRVVALANGADFWRTGVELQHEIRIGEGPRLLALRMRGDAVSGTRDEVPFLELPVLGGATFLRGYPQDRFRDRVATVGSFAYEWDLSRFVTTYAFVDAGRVSPSLAALDAEHLRVGYGLGAELHGYRRFLLEGSVASSIDGGVFVNLSLDPVLDAHPRWR